MPPPIREIKSWKMNGKGERRGGGEEVERRGEEGEGKVRGKGREVEVEVEGRKFMTWSDSEQNRRLQSSNVVR